MEVIFTLDIPQHSVAFGLKKKSKEQEIQNIYCHLLFIVPI